jgi:queuine tRNA-ribosyltransferase
MLKAYQRGLEMSKGYDVLAFIHDDVKITQPTSENFFPPNWIHRVENEFNDAKVGLVGLGGALDKEKLGTIVGWLCEELPDNKPRHLLGIGEPDDLFVGVENGADTFDCVAPSRQARTSAVFTRDGRVNLTNSKYQRQFSPLEEGCDCYTCMHYTAAYLNHLFKAKEMLASTLATIHNERFIVRLVDQMRTSIDEGQFFDLKKEFLGRFYSAKS